jgi:hypothetical protein
MATLDTTGNLTLLELANRVAPDGKLAKIAEAASKKVELLQYLTWTEANGNDIHQHDRRLVEPSGEWGRANRGVQHESSRTKPVKEPIATLESYNYIDDRIAKRYSDPMSFRATEDNAFKSGMLKEVASKFVYGNRTSNPDTIQGLANREDYDEVSDAQVIDGSGSGSDLMSVYLIKFDTENGLYGVYPPGDPTTMIEEEDLGRQLVYDSSNGGSYQAWVTHHKINIGLVISDPRAVVRVANLETSGTSNILTDDLLLQGMEELDDADNVGLMMNKRAWRYLQQEATDKANVQYQPDSPFGGRWIRSFMDIPVILNDTMLITESEVT